MKGSYIPRGRPCGSANSYHFQTKLSDRHIGYLFYLTKVPRTPMVLSLILGPLAESNLRRSITIYGNGMNLLKAYAHRPIALGILALTLLLLAYPGFKYFTAPKTMPDSR
jgi:putative tricarboxylic transport membrane protein